MKSSGIKRGAVLVAGTALALGGLATVPAAAQDVGEGETAFEFYTQVADASTRFDGSNNTVSMLAGVPDGLAGATEVRFSYLKGATQVEIAEVAINNGVAYTEWTPPTGAEGAAITGVRAQALDAAETQLAVDTHGTSPNTATGMGDNAATELAGALRSRVGLGPDNEVVIAGSSTENNPALNGVQNVGPTASAGGVNPVTFTPPDGNNVTQWKAVVPVAGANNTPDAEDEIVIRSTVIGVGGTSDDANVYTMYNQTVTNAAVTSDPAFPANVQLGGADDESRYNITVTDQEGQPIQGLNVCEVANENPNTPCAGFFGHGTPNTTETDVNGVATVSMFESDIDTFGDRDGDLSNDAHSTYYIVDVNQDGNYDDGLDWRFTLTQTGIVPVATTVELSSSKGNVLDDDETTDITATVKDQNGQPIANKSTVISILIECYDAAGNVELSVPIGPFAGMTNAAGQITFAGQGNFGAPCEDGKYLYRVDAFANNNGTPVPDAGDAIAETLNLDFDVTEIVWDNGTVAQALNGTTTSQTGTLQQVDGDALGADRVIAIDYNPTDNSEISDTQVLPTQKVNDTTATSETNAEGKFTVAVTDPALPNGQELNNDLTAEAPGLESAGDQTDGVLEIDFLRSITPASVVIYNATTGISTVDGLDPVFSTTTTPIPGGLAEGSVQVRNSDNVVLTDVDVQVTVDEGHFVDADDAFDPAPSIGGLFGEWKSAGKSITVRTEDDGRGDFLVNIERHEGFDDDGIVDDEIHATAGAATDEHDFEWTTNAVPLNTGSFTVELSEDQESSVLPKARAGNTALADGIPGDGSGQVVDYDVVTTDQFGNRTSQALNVDDNANPLAGFTTTGSSEHDLTQPAIRAFASTATDQSLEVELDGSISVKFVDSPVDSSFDPTAFPPSYVQVALDPQQEDTAPINWYNVDFGASTFTLGQEGPETVEVGTVVTEVVKAVDQEGQPIENMIVDFLRGGPSNEDDDTCNEDLLANCQVTDGNGEAFYDFVGGSEGTANVSAVLYSAEGVRITTVGPDTVIFSGVTEQVKINAKLRGVSSGNKDIMRVVAPHRAAGAKVVLQKKVGNKWVKVGKTKKLDGSGDRQFGVRDRNGNKITKYRAKVRATDFIFADTTPVKRQR